jgi:NTE family protein
MEDETVKLGLALSGGAARGLAHIGVLKALERLRIKPDLIAGTSIGAVIGAAYARGMSPKEIEGTARSLTWGRRAILFSDLAVPRTGLLRGRRIENFLKKLVGDIQFADLKIPFACIATDLTTGEEVVLQDGPVVTALRATISIPAIFTPAKRDGRILVDGGLRSPVPVSTLHRMRADFVIASNVEPSAEDMARIPSGKRGARIPNIYNTIMQAIAIVSQQRASGDLRIADIAVEPRVEDVGFGDYHKVGTCISRGEEATRLALEGTELARVGHPGSE